VTEPLAIIGMACRLPGADGLEAFWQLVAEGRTAWGPLPESRFRRDLYFDPEKGKPGRSYSDIGGLVPDRPVDQHRCPVTDELLERYDVAHHIFLEVASDACRDAGLDPFAMPADRRTGVYVGHTGGSSKIGDIVYATGIDEAASLLGDVEAARRVLGDDVRNVAAELTREVRRRYPGRMPKQRLDLGAIGAAAIVHEAMRLRGPFLVVDAACASSLQALAIAARSLLQGGIDQAIVGGASYCKSDSLVLFSAAQSVSATGSCPFGEAADGLVTAEGYVAIVLKTLSRAMADGDRIRAVIRGVGVASDGKGKSLWAPRQEGQVAAVQRAYADPRDLDRLEYIETHATSTQVGDATELAALARVMAGHVPPGRKLPIGSVKANIGHTLETAGIASLVKVVLSLEHGVIPPGSTCEELSRAFDWERGPFVVPREAQRWPAHADGSPRLAAVNAFGIGGLNVHVAIAEHVAPSAAVRPARVDSAPEHDAIAIVGAGCILPGSLSRESFFARLERGDSAIGPVPADRWDPRAVLDPSRPRTWHVVSDAGGFVRDFAYDWRRHKVPPKQIAAANPLQFMLLDAADEALADAGGAAAIDRTRTAVVVGTLFGGDFSNQLQMGLRLPETARYLHAALERRGLGAAERARIVAAYEKTLLEHMPALVDETGSFTSSTLASRLTKTFDLMGGALALDAGDCSSVAALAAAADMLRVGDCDAVLCAAGERCLDLMSYEGRSLGGYLSPRPTCVLEDLQDGGDVPAEGAVVFVLKRLADARAAGDSIRGVIRGIGIVGDHSPRVAVTRAIEVAHHDAGLEPHLVGVVQLATAAGSERSGQELQALGVAYGGRELRPVAGALDGLIGHAGAAAGAAGLLAVVQSLRTGVLPATAGLAAARREVSGLEAAGSQLPIPAIVGGGYRAASITVVQEGQAGHVLVDNGRPVPESPARRWPASAAGTAAAPVAAAAPPRPLVAALFPGQGSQYVDMFRELATLPEAAEALRELDVAARACGHPTLAEIAWHGAAGLGLRVWDTQWSIFLADLLAWGTLRRIGFAPDVIASHSFGEFPALVAADAWSVADGARAARARADAVERHGPRDGAMLSVIADRATVDGVLESFRDRVWICAENAPQQVVVGGAARDVDAVESLLEKRRVKSKRLAVPSPFHTPLLSVAAEHLSVVIDTLPIGSLRLPTFGSAAAESLADAAAIRESLVAQMTGPVRWIDTVQRLYGMGVRTFVEVGPSGVLTGLTRRILEGKEDVRCMQIDRRGRPPHEMLARLTEQLASAGALREAPRRPASPAVRGEPARRQGGARLFDATARRRGRNRGADAESAVPPRVVYADRPARGDGLWAPASAGVGGARASIAELETFLIDFVVEQTGYPREIVELDADLEADLGIDSIRKAHLVGEIGLKYGLSADDDVSFDAFPTLRHMLEYLLPRIAAGGAPRNALPTSGSWHRLVVASHSAHGVRGALVCFGRHARPVPRRFVAGGLSGTLVDLSGVHGAVAGWNDAGLVVLAGADGRAVAEPAVVERIVTRCRGLPAVREALQAAEGAVGGLVIAELRAGRVHEVDSRGRLMSTESVVADAGSPSPLTTIALADGARDGTGVVEELIGSSSSAWGLESALGSACVWFAVGMVDDATVCRSGGPLVGDWLGSTASQFGLPAGALARSVAEEPRVDESLTGITRRYRLEVFDRPACHTVRSLDGERVLLLGDDACGEPLAKKLQSVGALPSRAAVERMTDAVRAVEDAERNGPVRHLVVLVGQGIASGGSTWSERCEATLAACYFACQRWITGRLATGGLEGATLTAVVDLGGDFGLSGRMPAADGGGVAGLFKGLAREFPDLHVRVLDAPGSVMEARVTEALVAEMCDAGGPVETGLLMQADGGGGVRRVTVVPREASLPRPERVPASLRRGSVWLVTGGARGVTAACARELGRRHGVSLVVVGSTRPIKVDPTWLGLDEAGRRDLMGEVMQRARRHGDDPRSAWRIVEKSIEIAASLDRYTQAGVEARYVACDLADAAAVRRLVEQVEAEGNPIRGIVHGAGQESACRFERKTRDGFDATFRPKCLGLEHLMTAVDARSLECVVAFGSTSGRLGGLGQADYSLANELLAKSVAAWRAHRPGLLATTFHWHAWGEVGMASRPESKLALERLGLHVMPLAEGVRRFVDEIEAGLPDSEVLVTEPAMCPDALPEERASPATLQAAALAAVGSNGAVVTAEVGTTRPDTWGSLVDRVERRGDTTDVRFLLKPAVDRFLLEHRLRDRPLLPAVMGLEILAQAARAAGACDSVREVRGFVVERPLDFADDDPRAVRVEVAVEAGGARVRGLARPVIGLDRTVEWVHFHGVVPEGDAEPIVAVVSEPPFPFNPMIYQDDAPLIHGPSFRALQDLSLDRSGGWGRLVAPRDAGVARPRGRQGWTVPVELLDGALVACAVYSYLLCGRRVEIPTQIERVRFGALPGAGEACRMRLILTAQTPQESLYDFVMVGCDGRALVALEGLHLAIVAEEKP
jgi:acyl transferase domain-containing protein/acyl carrier protein